MPDIQKTRGIILRTHPFKESSLFCSVFSKDFGKLRLLAKGVRRPKSKICGTLEPFNHSEIIFYKREFKDVYTLSDALIIDDFSDIRHSTIKFTACEAICEFIDKIHVLEEPNPALYNLTLSFFQKLSKSSEEIATLWTLAMLFRMLKFAGLDPHMQDCVRCHNPVYDNPVFNFSISAGGLVCADHFDESVIILERDAIEVILNAKKNLFPPENNPRLCPLLKKVFESYVFYHLNGMALNALKFL
ncbi:MAG: DNA repair protein RecO [candidate division WOR-3 bacterium]